MAELSRFFNSEVGDVREYPASDFAEYFDKFLSDGIYTDNDSMGLNTTITGLVATVGEGFAFIKGYLYKNDADITFNLTNADAILSRIDRLVLKLDTVNRSMNVIKKEGTLGSNPTAPTLIDNASIKEILLVQIRVNATSSTGIITDERIPVSSISITTADMVIDTASKVLMLPAERTKLNGIATNAQVNAVTTVAGKTGAVVLAKADVGLGSVENYAKASQAEAEAGTSDVKYMTPLKTKDAVNGFGALRSLTGSYVGDGNYTTDRSINVGVVPKAIFLYGNGRAIVRGTIGGLGIVLSNLAVGSSTTSFGGLNVGFSGTNIVVRDYNSTTQTFNESGTTYNYQILY